MELFKGRPEDLAGREEREIRVYDLLDQLGIAYIRTDHEHAVHHKASPVKLIGEA